MTSVRDGQLSTTDLSIRADKMDSVAIALSEGSRMAAQNKEAHIGRHDTPPVSNDDTASPDLDVVVQVDIAPQPLLAENDERTAVQQPDTAITDTKLTGFSLARVLGVTAAALVALVTAVATVPSMPGHDRVEEMLSLGDALPRWKQSLVALTGRLVEDPADTVVMSEAGDTGRVPPGASPVVDPVPAPAGDISTETVADAPIDSDYQPPVGVIIRDDGSRERPQQVTAAAVTQQAITAPVTQQAGTHSGDVETLLALGRQALNEYRLVTPEGDNAYEYMAAALQLDAKNETARAGIQEIVEIYITLARKAIDANEMARAGRYLDRGLGIQPDNPDLVALKASLDSDAEVATITPAPQKKASESRQLTRDNMPLQKRPAVMKRMAAERRRSSPAPSSLGI
jgi:hypothetical protein